MSPPTLAVRSRRGAGEPHEAEAPDLGPPAQIRDPLAGDQSGDKPNAFERCRSTGLAAGDRRLPVSKPVGDDFERDGLGLPDRLRTGPTVGESPDRLDGSDPAAVGLPFDQNRA
jgi:hypothetical protein